MLINKFSNDDVVDLLSPVEYDYAYRFLTYVDGGLFDLGIAREDFRQILNDYGKVKNERNISNHARLQEQSMTAGEIKAFMAACLEELY